MSKILVLDQEEQSSELLEGIISQMGLDIDTTPDPTTVFEQAEQFYDLILLDADIPCIEECGLFRKIKNASKRIGVIVMASDQSDDHLARLLEMGAHDFISKPIQALEVETRVKSILHQQAYLKEIDEQNKLLELKMEELHLQKEILTEQKSDIAQANNDITESITYAKRIQEALLPSGKNIATSLPESFILFRAREIVSGDFYWFAKKQLSDYYHKLILAVVDCTGHGVPGAFTGMIGDAMLNQAVHDLELHEPDQILTVMDQGVRVKLSQEKGTSREGMGVSLCMLDRKQKILKFAGARQHLVYFQNNELFFIKGGNAPIGGAQRKGDDDLCFQVHTIDVSVPTWVYLYTDGYQSQFGGKKHRKLRGNRFRQLLHEIHLYPAERQKQVLEDKLHAWVLSNQAKGGVAAQLIDDVLVWGFKIEV